MAKQGGQAAKSLTRHTVALVAATITALLGMTMALSAFIVLGSFLDLERKTVGTNLERCLSALEDERIRLDRVLRDWAYWDDSYRFVGGEFPEYVELNLAEETFLNLRVDAVIFLDEAGRKLRADYRALPPGRQGAEALADLERAILGGGVLARACRDDEPVGGLMALKEGPFLAVAYPIHSSLIREPPRGSLVMGFFLDEERVRAISDRLKLDLRILPDRAALAAEGLPPESLAEFDAKGRTTRALSRSEIRGYEGLDDIEGRPRFVLELREPRDLYARGLATILTFFGFLAAAGIAAIGLGLVFTRRVILSRIIGLHDEVLAIRDERDLSRRVTPRGEDEIGALGLAVNELLDTLQKAQREKERAREELKAMNSALENRVRDRTAELARSNESLRELVEEKEQSERDLENLLRQDHLTGIASRAEFEERLDQAIARARRRGERAGLILMDLDRFKEINDSMGHAAGDRLLQAVAKRLSAGMRREDTVARWGGDEFTIVIAEILMASDVGMVAEKIRIALEPPFTIDAEELSASASIGIAIYPEDGQDAETLMKRADMAMYRAKGEGGGKARFYEPEMDAEIYERLSVGNLLRRALEREEFRLCYQPQQDLRSGRIVGVEALLRWKSAILGDIPPDRFIPVAERTGLIVPIGEWALRRACETAARWFRDGGGEIVISVNISPRQFREKELVATIGRILDETGLEPRLLNIEITEGVLMDGEWGARKVLEDLRALGLSISIDDFGVGYSSLSYLKEFPIQSLKIDKSFMTGIAERGSNLSIVKAIISLGKNMRLEVVAEGTENEAELAVLRDNGCDIAQGFCISRPLEEGAAAAFLAGHGAIGRHAAAREAASGEAAARAAAAKAREGG
ncbi:MAG: EAL domain-containing protein [Spirochaetaceae bacterium]|nr:EAL domain-containing protein [Spirochaetaceae bacterium]